jgi:hypothetical protein
MPLCSFLVSRFSILVLPAVGTARRGLPFAANALLRDSLALCRDALGFGRGRTRPLAGNGRVTARTGGVPRLDDLFERLGGLAAANVQAIRAVVFFAGLGDVNNDATLLFRRCRRGQPDSEEQAQAQAHQAHAQASRREWLFGLDLDHTIKASLLRQGLQKIYAPKDLIRKTLSS